MRKKVGSAQLTLLLATVALAVNFWAWSLLGPLGSKISKDLGLSPLELSILLAAPVIVGSLGRIFMGAITDRFGGQKVFSGLCFIAIVPVIMLAKADNYSSFLLAGTLTGISGTAFAVGIPFVNSWFKPEKRGLALGIYGMGNVGTAVSGFVTPRATELFSRQVAYLLVSVLLALIGLSILKWGKNAPSWKPSKDSAWQKLLNASKFPITWDLATVYAISFGAFVAFGVYLPVLLKTSYDLSLTDAASRAAGFVLLATLARPIGGFISDKLGGKFVIRLVLLLIAVLAGFIASRSSLAPDTTLAYLSLAVVLGMGNGAVFALLGKLSDPSLVGSITGIVGAIGGLGGFVPPLILGYAYQKTNSYSLALGMLAISSILVLVIINHRFKQKIYKPKPR